MTLKTRDQILPLSVPIGATNDLISPDVVSALTPALIVQDAPKFLIVPSPDLNALIAQLPVNSVLRLLAALILRSLILLTFKLPKVLLVPISLNLPSPREHDLLSAVSDLKPLLVHKLNMSVLLVLSVQR